MAELSLIASILFIAVVIAAVIARWVPLVASERGIAERLPAAVRRATQRFAQAQAGRAAICVALTGIPALLLSALLAQQLHARSLLLGGIGLLLGGVLSVGSQQLGVAFAQRFSSGVANLCEDLFDDPAVAALRGSMAIAAASELQNLALGLGALAWAQQGAAVAELRVLMVAAALAALAVTLFSQITGTSLHTAGQAGRSQSRVGGEAFRYQLDPRNPSLVLDGAGVHLGVSASRVLDACSGSLLSFLALVCVAGRAQEGALALIATTLVVRSLALLSALGAAALSRNPDIDGAVATLKRAQLSAVLLSCCGICGAVWWLLPVTEAATMASCGVLGVLGASAIVWFRARSLEARSRRVRDVRSAAAYLPLSLSDGAAAAVRDAGVPLLVLGAAIAHAWYWGGRVGQPLLAVGLLTVGFACLLPLYAAFSLFDPIVDAACGLCSLSSAHTRPQFQSRVASLNATALTAGAAAQSYMIALSGLLGMTLALCFAIGAPAAPALDAVPLPAGVAIPDAVAPGLPATAVVMLLAGVASVAIVLSYSGLAVRHVLDVTRACLASILKEFNGLERTDLGVVVFPPEYRPRYGEVLEEAFRVVFRGVSLRIAAATLLPVALLGAARWLWPGGALLAPIAMSFLAFATLTGLTVGLISEGTWSLLSSARRSARVLDERDVGALGISEAIAEFAGNAVGPTVQVVVKAVLAMCLVAVPAML